jgi:hypothetical protein
LNSQCIKIKKILAILLVSSSLCACRSELRSADMEGNEPFTELHQENMHSSAVENNKSMEKNYKRVKPGAAVSLKDTTPLYVPIPGVYEYRLSLISPEISGKMEVVASTNDGITILSPIDQFEFVLKSNGEYVLPFTINASQQGRFYIQLYISITSAEQVSSRVVAAIVQVGESPVKIQKNSTTGSTPDGVIVLPAQETISPR